MSELPIKGDRIELLVMPHDPSPQERGALGTVTKVVEILLNGPNAYQIQVDWDNGRTIFLSVPPDRYRIVDRRLE